MKALKILMVITALVVIVGLSTDTWAQCSSARVFRSSGVGGKNVRAAVAGTENGANVIGRFWDTDNSAGSNNGLTDVVGDGSGFGSLCAPLGATSQWWAQWTIEGEVIIDGKLTDSGCAQFGCPASRMTVVVEDYAAAGPPGIGDTAYYMGWLVDETPPATRWYDYAKVDGLNLNRTIPMLSFPDVAITGSGRNGGTVQIVYDNEDQTASNHTYSNALADVYPTSDIIKEWQLVKFTGSDPGRLRSLGWTTIQSTPYVAGGVEATFNVPCDNEVTDEWVAIGIGFNGGGGPTVDSALVGRAISLECDPTIADPVDVQIHQDRKPNAQELQPKPGRSGGRR